MPRSFLLRRFLFKPAGLSVPEGKSLGVKRSRYLSSYMTKFYSGGLCIVFTLAGLSASAQVPAVVKNLTRVSAQIDRAVVTAALHQQPLRAVMPLLKTGNAPMRPLTGPIPPTIRSSVFTVQATPESKHKGSAFAVNIDGHVWGVTARHVMDDINHTPYMTFTDENGVPVTLEAKPSKEGSAAGVDLALFEIPPQALPYLQPLELEDELPSAHSVLSSSGFARGNFLSQPVREVLFASQYRILTKYVQTNVPMNGYCGSPLLQNGKVAGVHIGSLLAGQSKSADWFSGTLGQFNAQTHDLNIAVPAFWLRTLARQASGAYTPQEDIALVFNGLQIMRLHPTDAIGFIMQLRDGRVIKKLPRYPFMDFAHLETFFDVQQGDLFRLEIQSEGRIYPRRQIYWYEWTAGENNITQTLRK